jgi:hypothetical protein
MRLKLTRLSCILLDRHRRIIVKVSLLNSRETRLILILLALLLLSLLNLCYDENVRRRSYSFIIWPSKCYVSITAGLSRTPDVLYVLELDVCLLRKHVSLGCMALPIR